MRQQRGVTFVEIMTTLAIVGVLAGISLPALSRALERTRAANAKAALVQSIATTINRAILGDSRAVLCPSVNRNSCSRGYDWSHGWIGFLDMNGDRERESEEPIFHQQGPLAGKVRLTSSEGRPRIVFQSNGGNAGSNVTFRLCDGRGPGSAESLVLNNRGGIRVGLLSPEAAKRACQP